MKVLLLGEVSAFNKNLKQGLLELGHEVTLLSNSNFRKIEGADAQLYKRGTSGLNKAYHYLIEPYLNITKYKNYDVVQIIRPVIFNRYVNLSILKLIKRNNGKLFLNALGNCLYVYNSYKSGAFRYNPFQEHELIHKSYTQKSLSSVIKRRNDLIVPDIVDGIIPVMYEYAEAYRKHPKIKKTIPLPININDVKYKDNIIRDKVVIFHGLNDEVLKGTSYIREALGIIKSKYKDEVEIIIDGNMPLSEYLSVIDKANIVVDQCKSYGYGMNAIYSMAQGKVVLSGAEPENNKEMGISDCPVINITPCVQDIVEKIGTLIDNKRNITQMGYNSRKYIEENHHYIKIAQKYVDSWENS